MIVQAHNGQRTVAALYLRGLGAGGGAASLLGNAEVARPALSLSYSGINSKSCVTDSTTKGGLKCQNDSSRKTHLRTLSCKTARRA